MSFVSPEEGKVNQSVNRPYEGVSAGLPESRSPADLLAGARTAAPVPTTTTPAKLLAPDNPFRRFHELGYTRLVSIAPPRCDAAPDSSLADRKRELGKVPGRRHRDGLWRGYDWHKYQPTEADYDDWHEAGAGVGIKLGDGLIAVDIDCMDADKAHICATTATEIL